MSTRPDERPVSGWAGGFSAFAGAVLILIGIFEFFQGLAAVVNDDFFVITSRYAYDLDTTGWGWIHMIIGLVLFAAGLGIFSGATWARAVGITVAVITAVANFFYIPYYPVWSVLIIALCIIVIWALASHRADSDMI